MSVRGGTALAWAHSSKERGGVGREAEGQAGGSPLDGEEDEAASEMEEDRKEQPGGR